MRRPVGLVLGFALVIGVSTWVAAQSGASPLEGAWSVQDITYPKPPAAPVSKPMGLIQFAGRHYSILYVLNSARPNLPDPLDKATAAQLLAIYGPVFAANAGTFAVTGNTVRFTRVVAKNPNVMAPGNFAESTFTVKGDTLILAEVRSNNGPAANPQTLRLTRVR